MCFVCLFVCLFVLPNRRRGAVLVGALYFGYIAPFSGRFYSMFDPVRRRRRRFLCGASLLTADDQTYASKYIPIIASVSEHQPVWRRRRRWRWRRRLSGDAATDGLDELFVRLSRARALVSGRHLPPLSPGAAAAAAAAAAAHQWTTKNTRIAVTLPSTNSRYAGGGRRRRRRRRRRRLRDRITCSNGGETRRSATCCLSLIHI